VATRRNGDAVTLDDFTVAIERIVAGLEKRSRILSPEERRRVAYHEMGHALVAATLPGVDPVHKVSIIPRGVGALGNPTEDRFLLARHDLENRIAVLMGGRAAEALVFDGEVSTGASDDLRRATEIATQMVTRYGVVETLGPRTYAPPPQPFLTRTTADHVEASEATEREIDIAVRDIVAKAFDRATEVLRARRADLDEGAHLLLQHETVTADQFPAISSAGPQLKPPGEFAG
jgi:cell division protease FtsH